MFWNQGYLSMWKQSCSSLTRVTSCLWSSHGNWHLPSSMLHPEAPVLMKCDWVVWLGLTLPLLVDFYNETFCTAAQHPCPGEGWQWCAALAKGQKKVWRRLCCNVKYGAVHLSSITTAFSVIVLKLVVLWRATFLLDLKWTNVSQEYKNKWPFTYCGRHEIVASVQVLTCAPITLISPPFPLCPHPVQFNTKTRHGTHNMTHNWKKLVPWRLPWPSYWAEQRKTHTNIHSVTGPEQTTRFILCSKSCCQISLNILIFHRVWKLNVLCSHWVLRPLPPKTAAKGMTEYHPTHKAKTFNKLSWGQGIPGLAVPISLNCIHYNSHHICSANCRLSYKQSHQDFTKFCCFGCRYKCATRHTHVENHIHQGGKQSPPQNVTKGWNTKKIPCFVAVLYSLSLLVWRFRPNCQFLASTRCLF